MNPRECSHNGVQTFSSVQRFSGQMCSQQLKNLQNVQTRSGPARRRQDRTYKFSCRDHILLFTAHQPEVSALIGKNCWILLSFQDDIFFCIFYVYKSSFSIFDNCIVFVLFSLVSIAVRSIIYSWGIFHRNSCCVLPWAQSDVRGFTLSEHLRSYIQPLSGEYLHFSSCLKAAFFCFMLVNKKKLPAAAVENNVMRNESESKQKQWDQKSIQWAKRSWNTL